jgi:hypothetical protein
VQNVDNDVEQELGSGGGGQIKFSQNVPLKLLLPLVR